MARSHVQFVDGLCMQATAIVSLAAGGLADHLQTVQGWSAVRVRRTMQLTATLGTGLRWGKVVGEEQEGVQGERWVK